MPKVARSRPKKEPNKFVLYIESNTGTMHGVYQTSLADLLGISQPAFSLRMKNGKFSHDEMVKIFNFFGATKEERGEVMM